MKPLTLLLFAVPLCAATITISPGSATDRDCATIPAGSAPCFTGGYAYTVQPAPALYETLRYGWAPVGTLAPPFSYSIPVPEWGAYEVDLTFMEPSGAPPARAFSVTINDQLVFPRLTTPGQLIPFARSVVVFSAGGFINIRFDTIARGALVSLIQVSPFAVTTYIKPSDPEKFVMTEAVPSWIDGAYYVPAPFLGGAPNDGLLYQNVAVYRNGLRQRSQNQSAGGADFSVTGVIGQLKITPTTGPWPATDTITVDYIAVFPPQFTPAAP